MEIKFHYDSATIAINELKRQGFTIDFNLKENYLVGQNNKYDVDNFKINDIYRYEGESDPADEIIIYAIESSNGEKGIFIAAYGMAPEENNSLVISRLNKVR